MTRPRLADLATAAAALIVLAVLGTGAWLLLAPVPSLDRDTIDALAAEGKFDEASAKVAAYLKARPDDEAARFLAAQLAVERPEPDEAHARQALDLIRSLKPETKRKKARVELYRGKARFYLGEADTAEASWKKALDLDPRVPEAAWCLLDMYYVEGRPDDARRIALVQHAIEPDPRDRVRYLLELARTDYQLLSAAAMIKWAEPKHRANPDDLNAALTLGRGLVLASKVDEGLDILRPAVAAHPDDPNCWDILLISIDEGAAPFEEFTDALEKLPKNLADQPRFARHFARAAQEKGDWDAAVKLYRRALEADPGDTRARYRLARALRYAGKGDEADRLDHEVEAMQAAAKELGVLYEEAQKIPDLGLKPDVSIYQRFADIRERMRRPVEAAAWHRLALQAAPDNATSREALARLDAGTKP